jgi:hypothetical protein
MSIDLVPIGRNCFAFALVSREYNDVTLHGYRSQCAVVGEMCWSLSLQKQSHNEKKCQTTIFALELVVLPADSVWGT